MDQGITPERYRVIPRILLFLFHHGRVLMLRRARTKAVGPGRYNGLGGHIEPGEDVLSAARRELAEEAGIVDVPLRMCGTAVVDVRPVGVMLFIFRGDWPHDTPPTLRASDEGELAWVPTDALSRYPLLPDLYVLLPRVIRWRPGDPLFHAVITPGDGEQVQVRFGG
ncbi:MAG: NUDIX domain-containing protein [Chloroflexi bacterium]|nr:NUDIX domain-containing protein [Chloroflexota bacterium]